MSLLRALRLTRAPSAALVAVGMLWGGFASMVPDIKATVGAGDGPFGLALLMSAVGGMIAMAIAPKVGRALGHWAIPLIGLALCAAFLYPAMASDVVTLGAALFGMGISVALLDITANVEISAREVRKKTHLMGVCHAMFSFGFAAAAYGAGLARQAGYGPDQVFPVLAVISVGVVALTISKRDEILTSQEADTSTGRRAPWVAVILTGVILFASFVGENATEAWSALHIERTLGAEAGHGSLGPATLGVVMGLGRLAGHTVTERLGHAQVIFWSAALGIIGALIIAGAQTPFVVIVGVSVIALGMAVIVPSANSILGAYVTEAQRSYALSRAWMIGIVGFFIGPAMMGGVAELFGLRISFVFVALIVALILPAIVVLKRQAVPKAG